MIHHLYLYGSKMGCKFGVVLLCPLNDHTCVLRPLLSVYLLAADDMGLGKTLTMISLVMQDKQTNGLGDDVSTQGPQWLNTCKHVFRSIDYR